jgi:hypothetical protein
MVEERRPRRAGGHNGVGIMAIGNRLRGAAGAIGIAAAVVLAVGVGGAQAASVSYSANLFPGGPGSVTLVPLGTSNQRIDNGTYTLPTFNPALGTLVHVDIDYSQTVNDTGLTVDVLCPGGDCSIQGNASHVGTVSLVGGPISVSDANSPLLNSAFCAEFAAGGSNCPGLSTSSVSVTLTGTFSFGTPTELNWFYGFGTYDLDAQLQNDLTASYTSNQPISFSFANDPYDWFGSATVTYYYDAVATPEPMSAALLGLGLAGLGIARRRKTSRSS